MMRGEVDPEIIEHAKGAIAEAKRSIARAKKEINSPASDALIDTCESLCSAVDGIIGQIVLLDDSG